MQYVWDSTGKRYLDGLGGIVTVSIGHCHPHVLKAMNEQNKVLQHSTTIYLNPNIGAFAEKLASKMPGELKVCYFVNSGSEANDLALLMARLSTGNYDEILHLPAVAKALGGETLDLVSRPATEAFDLPVAAIYCALSCLGAGRLTCQEVA